MLANVEKNARVVVAMSGGVDSSVAAALCVEAGYEVIGITLQLADNSASKSPRRCCGGRDIHDARRVAGLLKIPHYVLDYQDRFRSDVMEDFAQSYFQGRTPVPCIRCNERVKFRDLLNMAKDLSAAALVTGHYVHSAPNAGVQGGWKLFAAKDATRDQSYFLFTTTKEQLSFIRFPLGTMEKSAVRDLARRYNLMVADKPDSQDICFVPGKDYRGTVQNIAAGLQGSPLPRSGDIVNREGTVLGRHQGIHNYTVGQRHGLGIATGKPLYVHRIDPGRHQIVVGSKEGLRVHAAELDAVNWIGDDSFSKDAFETKSVLARVRSTKKPVPATIKAVSARRAVVTFSAGEDGVAPGQACVFYDASTKGDQHRVLGGGWITKSHENQPRL